MKKRHKSHSSSSLSALASPSLEVKIRINYVMTGLSLLFIVIGFLNWDYGSFGLNLDEEGFSHCPVKNHDLPTYLKINGFLLLCLGILGFGHYGIIPQCYLSLNLTDEAICLASTCMGIGGTFFKYGLHILLWLITMWGSYVLWVAKFRHQVQFDFEFDVDSYCHVQVYLMTCISNILMNGINLAIVIFFIAKLFYDSVNKRLRKPSDKIWTTDVETKIRQIALDLKLIEEKWKN